MNSRDSSSSGSISDWLLGGYKRRQLLAALFSKRGRSWTVQELRQAASCGQATAYETVMALREIELLESAEREHSFVVAQAHPLAQPLSKVIDALEPFNEVPVKRPGRGKRWS